MASITLANGLKTLFCMLGCVMTATLTYTIAIDGLPFRKELLTPWMAATLVDFFINVVPLATWVTYKESNWIGAILWVILLVCFGSITTCAYIFVQFLKLSPQESLQDPIYHALLRHSSKLEAFTAAAVAESVLYNHKLIMGMMKSIRIGRVIYRTDSLEHKGKSSSVVIARIIFSVLGFLMLGTLIYTLLTDGSPFRKELLIPWMTATLIDFYINVAALSVWVTYKESSWVGAFFWIILFICLGSITTCAYIVLQLFRLSSQDPVYLVLFNSGNRAENGYEKPYGEMQ